MEPNDRFLDEKQKAIRASLLDRVGSAHDNMAFNRSTIELNQIPTIPDSLPPVVTSSHQTTAKDPIASTSIAFHHINYHVGSQQKTSAFQRVRQKIFPCCKPSPSKQILYDVNGAFTFGMNAILGPSGCGKSSLLDILADRKNKNGLAGQILVDGRPRSKFFKYKIGYVVQEGQRTMRPSDDPLCPFQISLVESSLCERI